MSKFSKLVISSIPAVKKVPKNKVSELFLQACAANNVDAAKIFLTQGADINYRDLNSMNALFHASKSAGSEMINFLLDAGCDYNAVTPDKLIIKQRSWMLGRDPVVWAMQSDNPHALKVYLERGVFDFTPKYLVKNMFLQKSDNFMHHFLCCNKYGLLDMLCQLPEYKKMLSDSGKKYTNVLYRLVGESNFTQKQMLYAVACGVDPSQADIDGNTLLHVLMRNMLASGKIGKINFLLNKLKIDPNVKNKSMETVFDLIDKKLGELQKNNTSVTYARNRDINELQQAKSILEKFALLKETRTIKKKRFNKVRI